jgi:hypothetical protein
LFRLALIGAAAQNVAEFQAWQSGSMRSVLDRWLETTESLRQEIDSIIASEKKKAVIEAAVFFAAAGAPDNKAAGESLAGAPNQATQRLVEVLACVCACGCVCGCVCVCW